MLYYTEDDGALDIFLFIIFTVIQINRTHVYMLYCTADDGAPDRFLFIIFGNGLNETIS